MYECLEPVLCNKRSPGSLQTEKAHAEQGPSTAKTIIKINKMSPKSFKKESPAAAGCKPVSQGWLPHPDPHLSPSSTNNMPGTTPQAPSTVTLQPKQEPALVNFPPNSSPCFLYPPPPAFPNHPSPLLVLYLPSLSGEMVGTEKAVRDTDADLARQDHPGSRSTQ